MLRDFDKILKLYRRHRGLSQEDMAKLSDIPIGVIKRIENGSAIGVKYAADVIEFMYGRRIPKLTLFGGDEIPGKEIWPEG